LLNATANKRQHRFKTWLAIIAICEGIQVAITETLKRNVKELRPQPSLSTQSFPSGHTATSFAGAELLRSEFREERPIISHSDYGIAVATAELWKLLPLVLR